MEILNSGHVDADSQKALGTQKIHHQPRIRNYLVFRDHIMGNFFLVSILN